MSKRSRGRVARVATRSQVKGAIEPRRAKRAAVRARKRSLCPLFDLVVAALYAITRWFGE